MRFLITFSYDGTNFRGLEVQPKLRTVQGEMLKALTYINNKVEPKLVVSGRTDAMVHAKGQTAHVDIAVSITPLKLKRAMNSLLPSDIHVIDTRVVPNDFHARYMVLEKVYEYKLNMGEYNPIERNYVYQFNKKLDVSLMKKASKYFLGVHDFKAFTPNKDKRNSYVREIYEINITENSNIVTFSFRGNGFIKYQIRNMVGLLIQVGLGKKRPVDVLKILENKNRSAGFRTAHPEGLYLVSVTYKDMDK